MTLLPLVTGELIFEEYDSNQDGSYGDRLLTLVDGRGNTVKVLDAAGTVQARYGYTPAGKIELLSGSTTNIKHLYQQGWSGISSSTQYDATILRNGMYHDAQSNGVLSINAGDCKAFLQMIERLENDCE